MIEVVAEDKFVHVYKRIIKKAFQKVQEYNEKGNYKLQYETSKNIQVFYEKDLNLYKSEAILNARMSILFQLQSDIYDTRIYVWESFSRLGLGKLIYIKILEEFEIKDGTMFYIEFVINPDQLMYEPRYFQGIQWIRKNKIVIFKTCKHIKYEPQENNCKLLFVSWMNEIDEKKTFIAELIKYDFGGKLKNIDIECFGDRMLFLETIANKYYTVYDPYTCKGCRTLVSSAFLKCPRCQIERFGRCNDVVCFEPCNFDDDKCKKCNGPVTRIDF